MDEKTDLRTDVKKGTFGQQRDSIYNRDNKIWTSWEITQHCALNPIPNYNHTAYVRENWILVRQELAFLENTISNLQKLKIPWVCGDYTVAWDDVKYILTKRIEELKKT